MRVVPPSTRRSVAATGGAAPAPRTKHPAAERIAAGQQRQEGFHLLVSAGCLACCGQQAMQAGERGPELGCALAQPHVDPAIREWAAGCGVPQLFADFRDGRVAEVTEAAVAAAMPPGNLIDAVTRREAVREVVASADDEEPAQALAAEAQPAPEPQPAAESAAP